MFTLLLCALALAGPVPALAQPDPSPQTPQNPQVVAPNPPSVTAAGAVLYEPAEGRFLYGKDEQAARPIASLSKVMTALLALEAGTLDETVTVSAGAVATGAEPGAATLRLQPGQTIGMEDLLAGLVLRSGNDAAVAVAEHVAGTQQAFVARMNARAEELGMDHTSFVDASGLTDEPANRASPADLARLAVAAMSDPHFASWAGAPRLTVPGLGAMENRNELAGTYPGATGVKTGYTRRAGLCLIASATREDRTLIAVVLNSEDSFADAAGLLDHGFDDYQRIAVASNGVPSPTYRWAGATATLTTAEPVAVTVPVGEAVTQRVILDPVLERPAGAGTPAGRAELRLGEEVLDAAELQLAEDVPAPGPPSTPAAAAGASVQDAIRAFARLEPVEHAR